MAKKLYDLAVKTGEYTDGATGKTKGRWQNVGAVMANNDGGKFIMLDRIFNPAGVPNAENRSTVLLSMFEPRDANSGNAGAQSTPRQGSATTTQPEQPPLPDDDDIPF